MKRLIKWIAFLALIGVTLFVGSCAVVSYKRNLAFEQITDGTSEMQVISLFGDAPSVRESPTKVFSRYASSACASPCVERIWYENAFSLDMEAWSFEIDARRRVIHKAHWVSP